MSENERLVGLRAVATAMSSWSRASWTRWLPKPVEVPVMRKTRGVMGKSIGISGLNECSRVN